MATKDNNPGLLSKVAMFVRNPTTNWGDLDQLESSSENAFSRQALKEMIERKRQNDFVRKREFDQLRKLRKRGSGVDLAAEVARPSFFHSSLSSATDERANTLKKIDKIESDMSSQWWKSKPQGIGSLPGQSAPVQTENAAETEAPELKSSHFETTQATGAASRMQMPTQLMPYPGNRSEPEFSDTSPSEQPQAPSRQDSDSRHSGLTGSGFSTSKLYARETDGAGTDPELEEAAIRFANGDDAGAELALLNALQGEAVSRESTELWTGALFDLYRATGQQTKFEGISVEFAERFGRSAPAWFSMPDLIGRATPPSSVGKRVAVKKSFNWKSPAELTTASIEALQLALVDGVAPWHFDWSGLAKLQTGVEIPLSQLFAKWVNQSVEIRFTGAEKLRKALSVLTLSGDRKPGEVAWILRLDALQLMGQQDEFELAALDYCVTFEVSPPPWRAAQCLYRDEDALDGFAAVPNVQHKADDSGEMAVADAHSIDTSVQLELVGELRDDVTTALEKLEQNRQGSQRLVVSCAKLVRVDFAASGAILNWVAARQKEGCQVQFRDMHRLVAAFFYVIGINEHAGVIRRMT